MAWFFSLFFFFPHFFTPVFSFPRSYSSSTSSDLVHREQRRGFTDSHERWARNFRWWWWDATHGGAAGGRWRCWARQASESGAGRRVGIPPIVPKRDGESLRVLCGRHVKKKKRAPRSFSLGLSTPSRFFFVSFSSFLKLNNRFRFFLSWSSVWKPLFLFIVELVLLSLY